jgi:hypothetical protein
MFNCTTGVKGSILQKANVASPRMNTQCISAGAGNLGRDLIFCTTVQELCSWMADTLGELSITSTVESYLLSRGESTMESRVHGTNKDLVILSRFSGRLGWDSFIERRVSLHWLIVVSPLLSCRNRHLLQQAWGCQFITRLHKIVHWQWVYLNSIIHYKSRDCSTIPEHQKIQS